MHHVTLPDITVHHSQLIVWPAFLVEEMIHMLPLVTKLVSEVLHMKSEGVNVSHSVSMMMDQLARDFDILPSRIQELCRIFGITEITPTSAPNFKRLSEVPRPVLLQPADKAVSESSEEEVEEVQAETAQEELSEERSAQEESNQEEPEEPAEEECDISNEEQDEADDDDEDISYRQPPRQIYFSTGWEADLFISRKLEDIFKSLRKTKVTQGNDG